jgi:hypothetical protein
MGGATIFKPFPISPELYFYLLDVVLALSMYVISIVLFLKYRRDNMVPLLFMGLFIFPLQFSMWFLPERVALAFPVQANILEIFYLFFIKISLLVTLLLSRR